MEVKKFYDVLTPDGTVLDRNEVLSSPEAKSIIANFEIDARTHGVPIPAVSAQMIFKEMIFRGSILELKVKPVVQVNRLSVQQRFSPKFLDEAEKEGWLEFNGTVGVIHTTDGELPFTVKLVMGRYCRHCGVKLTDDMTGAAARRHVAEKHAGKVSPDPQNPSGYAMHNYYDCELEVQNG
jgi:hypothetical protein